MKKLFRTIIAIIFAAAGAGIVFLNVSALLAGVDWIGAIAYGSFAVIGIAFVALGWAVLTGKDIKEMLRDLFSGIAF